MYLSRELENANKKVTTNTNNDGSNNEKRKLICLGMALNNQHIFTPYIRAVCKHIGMCKCVCVCVYAYYLDDWWLVFNFGVKLLNWDSIAQQQHQQRQKNNAFKSRVFVCLFHSKLFISNIFFRLCLCFLSIFCSWYVFSLFIFSPSLWMWSFFGKYVYDFLVE